MGDDVSGGNFDKVAPVAVSEYDNSIRLFCGAYEEIFKLSQSCLRAKLSENSNILLVGAGSGMEIVAFAPGNPGWSFTGVDPSETMLEIAKTKIADKKITNNINLFQGYLEDLNTPENFDAATCILVMHFLKDDGAKLELLKSIYKRLKSGSILVLVDGCGEPGTRIFNETIKAWKQYPVLHGVDPEIVENAFNEVILKMIQFVPESRIIELLQEAGFTNIFKYYTGFLYSGFAAFKE